MVREMAREIYNGPLYKRRRSRTIPLLLLLLLPIFICAEFKYFLLPPSNVRRSLDIQPQKGTIMVIRMEMMSESSSTQTVTFACRVRALKTPLRNANPIYQIVRYQFCDRFLSEQTRFMCLCVRLTAFGNKYPVIGSDGVRAHTPNFIGNRLGGTTATAALLNIEQNENARGSGIVSKNLCGNFGNEKSTVADSGH